MIYETENLNLQLKNINFYFNLNYSLNKNERLFLNYVIEEYSKKDKLILEIPNVFFKNNLKLHSKDFFSFLERLKKKYIIYNIYVKNNYFYGTFNFINSFFMSENCCVIFLPSELKESKNKNTLLSFLNFKYLYNFKYKYTYKFYFHFFKFFLTKENFEVNFNFLKKCLNLENKYDRFFDFEKNVLTNILDDLKKFFLINYEKIKIGSNINNKIVGFKFSFEKYIWEKDEVLKLKSVLFLLKNDIRDASEVYSILKKGIDSFGYESIYKLCFNAKKNWKNSNMNFDDYLKFLISNFNNEIEPTFFIQKIFNSASEFRKILISEIEKIKPDILFDSTFFSNEFLTTIYNLNENKTFSTKNDFFTIIIDWKKNSYSSIKIYSLILKNFL